MRFFCDKKAQFLQLAGKAPLHKLQFAVNLAAKIHAPQIANPKGVSI